MTPLSCSNCWHNPLQNDAVGLPVGWCTLHHRVLYESDSLTCGHQKRKDLPLASARAAMQHHAKQFDDDDIVYIRSRKGANGAASKAPADAKAMANDAVGEVVSQWSTGAKIESLAQLRTMPGARAELAFASLSRAYVAWCQRQPGGAWTSGIHLLRWSLRRLGEEPNVHINDLRIAGRVTLPRQVELAQWSIVMLRLCFVSDMGSYARPHDDVVGGLDAFVERAAEQSDLSLASLMAWLRGPGLTRANKALPLARYQKLAKQLHKDRGEDSDD